LKMKPLDRLMLIDTIADDLRESTARYVLDSDQYHNASDRTNGVNKTAIRRKIVELRQQLLVLYHEI
jgi:hypothetical protein